MQGRCRRFEPVQVHFQAKARPFWGGFLFEGPEKRHWHAETLAQNSVLSPWPDPLARGPPGWLDLVNRPRDDKELAAIRVCSKRDRPYGEGAWRDVVIKQYGLESTLRRRP